MGLQVFSRARPQHTDEFNAAQLKAVCVEAGMIALREGARKLGHEHFLSGIADVQSKKKHYLMNSAYVRESASMAIRRLRALRVGSKRRAPRMFPKSDRDSGDLLSIAWISARAARHTGTGHMQRVPRDNGMQIV